MRMTMAHVSTVVWLFDYCATRFDDGVTYSVWYGGSQPLHPGTTGVLLGDVGRWTEHPRQWWATPDCGDADGLRWYGRFPSRAQAALFLLGMKIERDLPAQVVVRGQARPLTAVYRRHGRPSHDRPG